MTAGETASAYERNPITQDEAVERAMAEDIHDVYRRLVRELARHMRLRADGFRRSRAC